MLKLRKSSERGHANHGWLDSYHTFSFADYFDAAHMGFRCLRVINEDRITGGSGFSTHGHRDMEIISYVITGALEHKDTLGNSTVIWPGEIQTMSAGTGVQHSEYNHIKDKTSHFLQIWILPNGQGLKPNYGQKSFVEDLKNKDLVLAVAGTSQPGAITINQDVNLYLSQIGKDKVIDFKFQQNRYGWVQLVRGALSVKAGNEQAEMQPGDGLAISGVNQIQITATQPHTEFLLFDLP